VTKTVIIVPCFNEGRRLNPQGFFGFGSQGVELLFVDDGSTDNTRTALNRSAHMAYAASPRATSGSNATSKGRSDPPR
jgi:glycosyltransferase involved in cell wall biosynthesis